MPFSTLPEHSRTRAQLQTLEPRVLLHGGGVLDAAFGDAGVMAIPSPAANARITDMALLPDGRFMMTGTSTAVAGGNQLNVRRFHPDGTPDASFGDNGLAPSVLGGNAQVFGVAVQPDSKAIVVGSTGTSYFLLRYLTNGKHDRSFGDGGLVRLNFQANPGVARDVVIDPDGSIVIAGEASLANGTRAVALSKFQPNGLLDLNFGFSGTLLTKFAFPLNGVQTFDVTSMTTDSGGNYVLAGRFFNGSLSPQPADDAVAIMRVRPDGSPDPTFGNAGLSLADFGVADEVATGIAADAQDRPVAAVSGAGAFAAFRVLNNGRRDLDFGTNGLARVSATPGDTRDVTIDDGEIVLAGSLANHPRLARMFSAAMLDTSFGSDGITAPVPFRAPAGLDRVLVSPDGTYLVGGTGGIDATTGRDLSMSKYFAQSEPIGTLQARNLTAPQASSYVFEVVWRDPDGIDTETLGNRNLQVTGPNYLRFANLMSFDAAAALTSVTAKYKIAAPDGVWDASSNGTYTVIVRANQVADFDGDFVDPGPIGTFGVII